MIYRMLRWLIRLAARVWFRPVADRVPGRGAVILAINVDTYHERPAA